MSFVYRRLIKGRRGIVEQGHVHNDKIELNL
jgi:hypothetical protein